MNSKLRKRSGFTLIELSTVVAVAGILASSCAMVLRQAYLIHRNSLQTVATMRSLDLLRTRWSNDVQAAASAQIGDVLELRLADQSSITYSIDGARIDRQRSSGGAVVARDSWSFAEPVNILWAIDSSQPVSLISMKISSTGGSDEQPPWTFVARLNAMPSNPLIAGRTHE